MTAPTHRLALARTRAGLSLGQAAQLLGMPRQDLEAAEASAEPAELLCARLARLYEVNLPWLRGEVPERAPESALGQVVCTRGVRGGAKGLSEHDKGELLSFIASMRRDR